MTMLITTTSPHISPPVDIIEEWRFTRDQKSSFFSLNPELKPEFNYVPLGEISDLNMDKLKNQIFSIVPPKDWKEDGVKPPHILCKKKSEKLIFLIYQKCSLIPERIAPTIEEGIFFNYYDNLTDKELMVEVYNDNYVTAILKRGISTLDIINVAGDEDILRLIHRYQNS